jgi:DNA-binding transcriptional regulator YdaS (Cro superfamily)
MNLDDVQARVTHNVRVLMAVRRIHEQQQLAALLGWAGPKLNKSLKGHRRWALEDLVTLATVLGVQPGDLLGDTATLVGVNETTQVAGMRSVTDSITSQ